MYKKTHFIPLGFAISLAVLLHFSALYFLHGVIWVTTLSGKVGMENQHGRRDTILSGEKGEKDILKKNEELAAVFKKMAHSPSAESRKDQFDFQQFEPEFMSVHLETAFVPPQPTDLVISSSLIQGIDVLPTNQMEHIDNFLDSMLDNSLGTFADVPFSDEKSIIDELLRATNIPPGSIQTESEEPLDSSSGILIGQAEQNLSFDENAFKNNSGLIDIGIEDDPTNNLHLISAPTDLTSLNQAVLDNLPHHPLPESKPSPVPIESSIPSVIGDPSRKSQQHAGTIASSKDFILEVEYAPMENKPGYLFCIKLTPKKTVSFKRIRHNLFFLIDRSHSISLERYEATKKAVLQSLCFLDPEDTFNILVFDDKVVRLSDKNLPKTSESFALAEKFLSEQQHGGILATTDLYSSLGDIIPDAVADTEVNTAILLSDGDTYLSRDSQRQMIGKWTKQNKGKVSLFSIAAGKRNNLPLLDVLSSFNKGSLCYSPQFNGLPETLTNLLCSIQNPIGKDISVTAVSLNSKHRLTVYPSSQRAPDLYEQIPYVIYGSTEELQDFYLFLQGKYYDSWLDIKQVVSFGSAKKVANKSFEKLWAIQQAYDSYDRYLIDGKSNHLTQAQQLLGPFKIPLAFQ